MLYSILLTALLVGMVFLFDCKSASVIGDMVKNRLSDGVYEGAYNSWLNKATVKVTIKEGSIGSHAEQSFQ
jgi:major membrane immunogen (membrane-anchored lipoprotein)